LLFEFDGRLAMPYDRNRSGSSESGTDPQPSDEQPGEPPAVSNPFLQFVDPAAYRQLVERAVNGTEAGRLITPLSRLQQRKGGASGIGGAWDEELADDGV
jgi:hypothetical protein